MQRRASSRWGATMAAVGQATRQASHRPQLRQKIEQDPANPHLIRSVRGFGYSFNDAVAEEAAHARTA